MAPKKSAPQPKDKAPKADTPHGPLLVETCPLPVWDDAEIERESWGDLNATTTADPSALFVDPDFSGVIASFGTFQTELRRPSAIFSPFKPVVFRPQHPQQSAYEFDPTKEPTPGHGATDEDEEQASPRTRAEMVALYRTMKPFRIATNGGNGGGKDGDGGASPSTSPSRRINAKKHARTHPPTPLFMRAFNSALMVLSHNQHLVPEGQFAWELVYPKSPTGAAHLPLYNPTGKYAVKLFVGGAFRKVLIDDRLPIDAFEQSILTVTEQKELWPALLAKAMLKALGPQHEALLLRNPLWATSVLMQGWVPQVWRPLSNQIATLMALRDALVSRGSGGASDSVGAAPATGERYVVCAMCNNIMAPDGADVHPEEYHTAAGLQPGQLYTILDLKAYQNTSLLRLCGFHAAFGGPYQYGSSAWNTDLEAALEFNPATDRNPHDLAKGWNDFWISWESFEAHFGTIAIFRDLHDTRHFREFRQIHYVPDPVAETKAPTKAAAAAAARDAKDAVAPPVDRAQPKNVIKWLHFSVEVVTSALVTFSGIARPPSAAATAPTAVPGGAGAVAAASSDVSIALHRYQWSSPEPLSVVATATIPYGTTQSIPLRLQPGVTVFRLAIENMPADSVVAVAAPVEFVVGGEKEVVRDILGVVQVHDAGVYGAHAAHQATTWFKRVISVKQDTAACFLLSTLPKGTDLAQHRTIVADAPSPSKGKGGAGAGGKGAAGKGAAPATSAEVNDDEIDDNEYAVPMSALAKMRLINLDTQEQIDDTVGKIMGVTLRPNKAGWLLLAAASPDEPRGKGYWKLSCTASRMLDSFEARPFEELTQRSGEYVHNDFSSLFRFNFTVAEPATATMQLCLREAWGIPFTLRLLHNDKEIASRTGTRTALIEHVAFVPGEKTTPSAYAVHCTLDDRYTSTWEEGRRAQVVQQFRNECAQQEQHLLDRAAMVRALLERDPEAAIPDEGATRPGSVIQVATGIRYDLMIHCSTGKLEMREDNSIAEDLSAAKAAWSRAMEGDQPPAAAAPAKGAPRAPKGQPVVDEGAVRQQKAKEARERFMANRKGIFVPYVRDGKLFLEPEDEPDARLAPVLAEGAPAPTVPPRLHGGIFKGAPVHGGVQAAAVAVAEDGTGGGAGGNGEVAPGITVVPPTAAAAAPAARPATEMAAVRQIQAAREIEELLAQVNLRKERRKRVMGGIAEALLQYWNDENPNKPMTAAEASPAEDEKKKGTGVRKR